METILKGVVLRPVQTALVDELARVAKRNSVSRPENSCRLSQLTSLKRGAGQRCSSLRLVGRFVATNSKSTTFTAEPPKLR